MTQDGATKGGTFYGEMKRKLRWTTACRSCPNVTKRTNERIAQSKRACVGSLAIVARTSIIRAFFGS